MAFSRVHEPKRIEESLKYAAQKLKIDAFKELQVSAISHVLRGDDVFVSLPTGFGKSAIYQALPLCSDNFSVLQRQRTPWTRSAGPGEGSEDTTMLTGAPDPPPRSIALVISLLFLL